MQSRIPFLIFLLFISVNISVAQNASSICGNGDCPSELFSIQLDGASGAGAADASRTERFKKAWQEFQKIKAGYTNDAAWKSKRDASMIGGKNCLRHYQLEAHFAHEYAQNPEFKKFLDAQGVGNGFTESGFQSSRKGINLKRRMESQCPNELKDLEKNSQPPLQDLSAVYQKLGRALGYFDEQGNLLKPLDPPPAPAGQDLSKMNKKQTIAYLKDQVAALPVGQTTKSKIDDVKQGLEKAKPRLGLLKGALGLLGSRLGTFLPGPLGLTSKLKSLNDAVGLLKNFVPKISVPGLLSKIGGLFSRGKGLADKAKGLVDKSNALKDKLDGITGKADELKKKVDDKITSINDLQKTLDDLAQKKNELTQKLEDKPRKILDELKSEVSEVVDKSKKMVNKLDDEVKEKNKILDELTNLEKLKEDTENQLAKLEDEFKDLTKQGEDFEKEVKAMQQEVEDVKKQEQKLEEIKKQVDNLKPETEIQQEIADCESDLRKILADITGLESKQEKIKGKLGGLFSRPGKLLGKVSDLKLFQEKLKLPKDGIPLADKTLAKLDKLSEKATTIGALAQAITGKQTSLQSTINDLDAKLDHVKNAYNEKYADLDQLKNDLATLIAEKSGINAAINGTVEDVNAVESKVMGFLNRYNLLDEQSNCKEKEDLKQEVAEVKDVQEEVEPEVDQLDQELSEVESQIEQLETETQQVQELIGEEQNIKKEYGEDVELDPVEPEEWAESFAVERPYWEAVFHPDDEVVEGQKGRYFEVELKDANKNVKLLFGPGEYSMSKTEFRKRYGKTVGTFVTEALNAMKKADQEKVKIYIQGSADIVGQNTFSGNLNEQFHYDQIEVLPQKENLERFANTPVAKEIPEKNFRNEHLPDLRAQYLREMIRAYSKKFDPIVLEGTVKDFKDEKERNAIIYLFIPEELVEVYGGN
ncbi:MAG: hypothetical protein D6816_08935 [Bacteroidetes bacterium]|nr:MAG: hypothetical protein D6816_08935 [Bacteroidota bacterium]